MKIGILICDEVRPEFKSHGEYAEMMQVLFPKMETEVYFVFQDNFPTSVAACDAYITNGSSKSVYENLPWINKLKTFILEIQAAEKIFIGLCFGHQLLAEALGGKVEKAKTGWCVGVHRFEMLVKEDWMQPHQASLNLLMMCQDQVVKLPEGATVLASTEKCPVGIFRAGNMLGIQAHPDFTKAYVLALMEARVHRMGEAVVQEGRESLELEIDSTVLVVWMQRFVEVHSR